MLNDITTLTELGEFLIHEQYLSRRITENAILQARTKQLTLIQYLTQYHILDELKLTRAIAEYFHLAIFDMSHCTTKNLPLHCLPLELLQCYLMIPLEQDEENLLLGIMDPTLVDVHQLNFITGMNIQLTIVAASALLKLLDQIVAEESQTTHKTAPIYTNNTISPMNSLKRDDQPLPDTISFLNKILLDAIRQKASDIHLEPQEHCLQIRYRIDGVLINVCKQPLTLADSIGTRLKVIAKMDIAQRRLPQDGHFIFTITGHRHIDLRVSTCPTQYGEKIVLRILQSTHTLQHIETLGLHESQQALFKRAICQSQGMILVTGPTGSGKTMTLYTALEYINSSQINITTIEDPIEINLPGVNQIQVNLQAHLTFSTALRALLRQDPDVIMIGEMRDELTAEIAIKAAQTGHLVIATLHTNNAKDTLARLFNMGLAQHNLANCLSLIVAQRLVRLLCPFCKQVVRNCTKDLNLINMSVKREDMTVYQTTSCEHCHQGYQGRTGIFELLPISDNLNHLLMTNDNMANLLAQADKDMVLTLRQSGLIKVNQGLTSAEELFRVIH